MNIPLQLAEHSVDRRLTVDRMIVNISSRFMRLRPDQIDTGITWALQQIGEHLDADIGRIFMISADGKRLTNTHEWCAPNIPQQKSMLLQSSTWRNNWYQQKLNRRECIYLYSLDEMPIEAVAFKRDLQSRGVCTLLTVPIFQGERLVGTCGVDTLNRRVEWHEDDLDVVKVVAELIGLAIERKQSDDALRQRIEFEQLVADISAKFMEVEPNKLDDAINYALQAIGEFSNVDASRLFLRRGDPPIWSNTHEWCGPGIHSQQVELTDVMNWRLAEWWTREMASHKMVYISDVVEANKETNGLFDEFVQRGIKSALSVPLIRGSDYIGELGLDAMRTHKEWSEENIRLLGVITQLLINALDRQDAAVAIERERALLEVRVKERTFELLLREQALALHADILRSIGNLVLVANTHGEITYVSPSVQSILGYQPDEIMKEGWWRLARQGVTSLIAAERNDLCRVAHGDVQQPTALHEQCLQHKDGSWRWLLMDAAKGPNGLVICVCTDITERKAMEGQLAKARDEALEASRLKSEFLAMMSHEIRTPMNAVIGMGELLLETNLTAQQRELAGTVNQSAQSLLLLINDILDFSKIEAGRMTIEHEAFSIREVVNRVLGTIAGKASEKRLQLDLTMAWDTPKQVVGDAARVGQVLLNLLSNAIKFTERGSVTLRISRVYAPAITTSNDAQATLRFEVIDTGIGLSEMARRRLFQPFVQADGSITRRFGGTGLGLTICKRLVEMMGGNIDVESVEGAGARFYFQICFDLVCEESSTRIGVGAADMAIESADRWHPMDVENSQATLPAKSPSREAQILVVDDNAANQRMAVLQLQKLGYTAEVVGNGLEAVRILRDRLWVGRPYALVLMDCQMPEMDGFTATQEIRLLENSIQPHTNSGTASAWVHIPIIAMTASTMQGDRDACIEAGMDDYLSKPVRLDALRNLLARWLPVAPNERVTTSNGTGVQRSVH